MAKRTYYRDAKGRFASKGTPGAKAVTVDVDREKKRIKKELNQKQRAKLDEVLARKQLSVKALTQVKKELDGMNLSELRKLTQKVGAKQPEKYRNRKDAWRQAILEKVSGDSKPVEKPKRKATKEELLAGGNAGSKRRNLQERKVPLFVEKQLNNPNIDEEDKQILRDSLKMGVPKPFPLGDGRVAQQQWRSHMRDAHSQYENLQSGLQQQKLKETSKKKKSPAKKTKKEKPIKSEGRLGYGNKGSKKRNQDVGLWLTKQLLSLRTPDDIIPLLSQFRKKELYKKHILPYPLGGSGTDKAKWEKAVKELIANA